MVLTMTDMVEEIGPLENRAAVVGFFHLPVLKSLSVCGFG